MQEVWYLESGRSKYVVVSPIYCTFLLFLPFNKWVSLNLSHGNLGVTSSLVG